MREEGKRRELDLAPSLTRSFQVGEILPMKTQRGADRSVYTPER
jgi:hypothetical protein